MKKLGILLLLTISLPLAAQTGQSQKPQNLFNGKDLTGWDTYIGPAFDSLAHKRTPVITGLNNDPDRVFTVANVDGQAAIRISGRHFGGISTKEEFENYHLRLEFRWGKAKWAPKAKDKRDSGLLYHAVGSHGADGGFWMRSQEFQIQESDCGDYWGVAGAVFDIPARKNEDGNYVYDPGSPPVTFSASGKQGRHCIKNPDAEKPSGEWNVVDLYCLGSKSVHVMNGKVVMVLYNSRQEDKGKETPLTKGKIQIQCEGAEVFFRNIVIERVSEIPRF
jgi:hypothetical protein